MRALLVDDNLVNQKVAGAMLAKLGLSYDLAGNGVEAVRCVGNKDYALVLMDVEMPEMDGITATQRIRDREVLEGRARLPIIAMTARRIASAAWPPAWMAMSPSRYRARHCRTS